MSNLQSFSFISLIEMIFEYFCKTFGFLLPWQSTIFTGLGLDKTDTYGTGLLTEHFCKTFVKISAVR